MLFPLNDPDFVKSLNKQKETDEFDFKLNISDSLKFAKTLVAFANTKGGNIAIGINDQKLIRGIDPEEELYMVEKAANEYCEPKVNFESQVYEVDFLEDEKLDESLYILLIKIKKSKMTHFLKSKTGKKIKYIRQGDSNFPDVSFE
ncbi:ATP-binding protein [Belliella sp. R4-6]|uniref:ATP-binding protein n=1 Tax=Belliella alkalica TaxID=1730871 RepID=A0ABS9VGK2_9BACT|nr:ATP-binding protein [Belliella alkalica]MCH7415576.1 ATP-binding protein [Belliella alkalica]